MNQYRCNSPVFQTKTIKWYKPQNNQPEKGLSQNLGSNLSAKQKTISKKGKKTQPVRTDCKTRISTLTKKCTLKEGNRRLMDKNLKQTNYIHRDLTWC